MNSQIVADLVPMVAVFGLFWHVALKLGHIQSEMREVRQENRKLRSDLLSLQTLMSVLIDSRRNKV
jgi:hypothetical protein